MVGGGLTISKRDAPVRQSGGRTKEKFYKYNIESILKCNSPTFQVLPLMYIRLYSINYVT